MNLKPERLPILVLTPHNSGHLPTDILADMLGADVYTTETREKRLAWMFDEGDPYTDVIYHAPEAYNFHAQASRFVVDLNRRRDEEGDNGVIKLTDFERRPLYPRGFILTPEKREERLRRYFDSFHHEVEAMLERHDIRLIIDGHSMQPYGPKISPDASHPRPAITLMTSSNKEGGLLGGKTHTTLSKEQTVTVMTLLRKHFGAIIAAKTAPQTIALNDPWDHDELSYRYSDPKRKNSVPAFAIEFNRALYLEYQDNKEYPKKDVIKQLNQSFQNFLREVVTKI
jgi:N-formylglutamate deformylase